MKSYLALLSVLAIVFLFSCNEKEDEITYPFTLTYSSFSSNTSISTYVKGGKITTPAYIQNDDMFNIDDEEFAKFIKITSLTKASFVYCDKNDLASCENDTTSIVMEANILDRNDSIIFENLHPVYSAFFPELPSKGNINEELIFPRMIYIHTDTENNGGSVSTITLSETVFGAQDFSSIINGLGDGDTFSVFMYQGIYKK